jgi:hypothetical protein
MFVRRGWRGLVKGVSLKAFTSHTTIRLVLIAGATYAGTCLLAAYKTRTNDELFGLAVYEHYYSQAVSEVM